MNNKEEKFVYCDNIKCNHKGCLRRYTNAPWGVMITVDRYYPDKENVCKKEVLD